MKSTTSFAFYGKCHICWWGSWRIEEGRDLLGQTFADLNGVGEENEKNGQQVSFRKDVKEGGRLLSSFTIVEIERGEVQSCLQRPSSHVVGVGGRPFQFSLRVSRKTSCRKVLLARGYWYLQ